MAYHNFAFRAEDDKSVIPLLDNSKENIKVRIHTFYQILYFFLQRLLYISLVITDVGYQNLQPVLGFLPLRSRSIYLILTILKKIF